MPTNRLAKSEGGKTPNQCPPDMPKGKGKEQQAARMKFWIERGNRELDEAGQHRLQWCAKDGNYWIEER